MGDRFYEFQTEFKAIRDKWFEVLKNSRKTAKDIKSSITKKPRNLNRLLNVFEKDGPGKLKTIAETEKDNLLLNYKDM